MANSATLKVSNCDCKRGELHVTHTEGQKLHTKQERLSTEAWRAQTH